MVPGWGASVGSSVGDDSGDGGDRYAGCYPASIMEAKGLTPILNVSDIASTVA
jgi:hypothetical protein